MTSSSANAVAHSAKQSSMAAKARHTQPKSASRCTGISTLLFRYRVEYGRKFGGQRAAIEISKHVHVRTMCRQLVRALRVHDLGDDLFKCNAVGRVDRPTAAGPRQHFRD